MNTDDTRKNMELNPRARTANRLAEAISPYLLQHANNPVAWQPWDDAALAQAVSEDKAIFLSIGYAACHWCHVMEHESFENEAIAALMNKHFINIKVDREERPDLDDIYMKAVVAMTGQGGWPMSVFLTPDLKPFYGGTYFPPERRYGVPGFRDVLEQIASYWAGDRSRLLENAEQLVALIQNHATIPQTSDEIALESLSSDAVQALDVSFDEKWGGWNGAPKFPSSPSIALLLRESHRNNNERASLMAITTLDRMSAGGIYDHLGGGFHRYSVDGEWRLPHFEKMLYDNAQLAVAYLEAWQVTGKEAYRTVTVETLDYLLRDMQDASGGFYASQDADSEGGEGAYYLWTYDEIMKHLGEEKGKLFCECYDVKPGGNFASHDSTHHGKNVLFKQNDAPELTELREVLLKIRQGRAAPQTDDKILASWNALAITAFAKAALALGSAPYAEAAIKAGCFLRDSMMQDGRLMRAWRKGTAHLPAYLDDYAAFAIACLDLYECTADFSWIELARALVEKMIENFHNEERGGFYTTGQEHKHLLARMQPMHDTAEPSGNALATLALLRLAAIFGEKRYEMLAEKALAAAAPMMQRAPAGFLTFLLATDYHIHGAVEITFAGDRHHPTMTVFRNLIGEDFIPNRLLIYAGEAEKQNALPVMQDRDTVDGLPAAWVCKNRVCFAPATTVEQFIQRLEEL